MTKCDFSFRHYEEIIQLAKQKYDFFLFSNYLSKRDNRERPRLYLRHDVDLSLEKALAMAKVDKNNDVISTFFIRFDSLYYNVFTPEFRSIIQEILSFGHQVGVHFDDQSNRVANNLDFDKSIDKIKIQIGLLSEYFNIQPVVSFHRPGDVWFGKDLFTYGLISTYSDVFFNKTKYLSDSRGAWKEGCVCKYLQQNNSGRDLQILTHPIWWDNESKIAATVLSDFLNDKLLHLDSQMANEFEVYSRRFLNNRVILP